MPPPDEPFPLPKGAPPSFLTYVSGWIRGLRLHQPGQSPAPTLHPERHFAYQPSTFRSHGGPTDAARIVEHNIRRYHMGCLFASSRDPWDYVREHRFELRRFIHVALRSCPEPAAIEMSIGVAAHFSFTGYELDAPFESPKWSWSKERIYNRVEEAGHALAERKRSALIKDVEFGPNAKTNSRIWKLLPPKRASDEDLERIASRWARSILDGDESLSLDAEDLKQEFRLKLLKARAEWRRESSFKHYLAPIRRTAFADIFRAYAPAQPDVWNPRLRWTAAEWNYAASLDLKLALEREPDAALIVSRWAGIPDAEWGWDVRTRRSVARSRIKEHIASPDDLVQWCVGEEQDE